MPEIGEDLVPGPDLERLHAGAGGDELAGGQHDAVARELVGDPGERDARVSKHVGAAPLTHRPVAGTRMDDMRGKVGAAPGPG